MKAKAVPPPPTTNKPNYHTLEEHLYTQSCHFFSFSLVFVDFSIIWCLGSPYSYCISFIQDVFH